MCAYELPGINVFFNWNVKLIQYSVRFFHSELYTIYYFIPQEVRSVKDLFSHQLMQWWVAKKGIKIYIKTTFFNVNFYVTILKFTLNVTILKFILNVTE